MDNNPPSVNKTLKRVSQVLRRTERYLKNDEIVCACYLYKAMEYGDKKAYQNFKNIFKKLSDDKRYCAINYYLVYARNRHNKNIKVKQK